MRYAPKIRRYTAFTRGAAHELICIPLKAYNDADAVARAVYQCEGRRQLLAALGGDLTHSRAYLLSEVVCDDDNGRQVWESPLLSRPGAEPGALYLSDRERGWV